MLRDSAFYLCQFFLQAFFPFDNGNKRSEFGTLNSLLSDISDFNVTQRLGFAKWIVKPCDISRADVLNHRNSRLP